MAKDKKGFNVFKSYTYTWKEMAIFKIAMLSIGALIGSYWSEFFISNVVLIAVVAVFATVYTLYISFNK
ncbi:hypothetical protein KBD45_04125 [Candidatus Dojkabacteria bacterium]|nr:hypothetical protein [Candidatus Dojkabacteria bacterium]